jgi:hypothetical protein
MEYPPHVLRTKDGIEEPSLIAMDFAFNKPSACRTKIEARSKLCGTNLA